jgi:hypothetical protein
MNEIWEILMPFNTNYYFDGKIKVEKLYPRICYRSGRIDEIVIADTREYQDNNIRKAVLCFIPSNSKKLATKYNLIVKQYSLSEKSKSYWKGQLDNNQNQGSLHNKQPYQILGNIKSIDNPDEVVLGIFETSAVSTKDIIVGRPPGVVAVDMGHCEKLSTYQMRNRWTYPYWEYTSPNEHFYVTNPQCIECEASGGTSVKPENWD